jgi:hypothetical protein
MRRRDAPEVLKRDCKCTRRHNNFGGQSTVHIPDISASWWINKNSGIEGSKIRARGVPVKVARRIGYWRDIIKDPSPWLSASSIAIRVVVQISSSSCPPQRI